ncbi:uncharacterized protein B0H18DRAFT_1176611 [Fomitopsis serialis]|uniref:uncharacterized protein n=1 Tax=Fomitopsis serialis TaxID=139415 RepID=UPI0020086B56|nr:uncharacterized protein B0H18DRAFT_1176611 [Neoantrodia serialis]KAH9910657.1 hypothetical protein B0H18DRAFT_1176611 [Neoantrodia serialis]
MAALVLRHDAAIQQPLFQRALKQYINGLDEKAKTEDFFAQYFSHPKDKPPDPDAINCDIQDKIGKHWSKSSTIGLILQTLANIQTNYDGVVNTLTSLDPTNISVAVWACVGVLAKAVDCYFKIPEKISKALVALGDDLTRISTYNRLFGDSAALENILIQSYVDILRFWNKVFRELRHHRFTRIMSALVLRTDKFDNIISTMRTNTERVERQIGLVQQERAHLEKLKQTVRSFLGRPIPAGAGAIRDSCQNSTIRDQCCDWIFENPTYQTWRTGDARSPALWVYAPPGSGKSTLCRRVVQAVQRESPSVAVASHFFQFDQEFTTLDVLKSLAAQLWESSSLQHSSYSLLHALARLADDKTKDTTTQVRSILDTLIQTLPTVYIFIDGVDEEVAKGTAGNACRDNEASFNTLPVLDVINSFVTSDARTHRGIRLWISSQDIPYTRRKFEAYTLFNIKDAVKSGIWCYLSSAIHDLTFVPPEQRDSILQQLMGRVESNFLWAHLMVVELTKATTLAEMDRILGEGRVGDLDAYYARFLDNLKQSTPQKVAISRDVFSLVTFARRPLKIGEIQEAIAVLNSRAGHLDDSHKPFLPTLLELLSPLIEVQPEHTVDNHDSTDSLTSDQGNELQKTCRLFHSTLFDFLNRHAELLCGDIDSEESQHGHTVTGFCVCPLRIADACLLYLAQTRYSWLLRRQDNTWVDAENQHVSAHHFLTYSAKNWDKHLDLVSPNSNDFNFPPVGAITGAVSRITAQFRIHVENFLSSSNFQTCIQVQSLWIDGAFSPYEVSGDEDHLLWVRRSLPHWIGAISGKYRAYYYHRFWWDWFPFLSCATCDNPRCEGKATTYSGAILVQIRQLHNISSDNNSIGGVLDGQFGGALGGRFGHALGGRFGHALGGRVDGATAVPSAAGGSMVRRFDDGALSGGQDNGSAMDSFGPVPGGSVRQVDRTTCGGGGARVAFNSG